METARKDIPSLKSASAVEAGENPAIAESKSPLHTPTDWDGPEDVGNPRNWSFGKKIYATIVPALYAFAVCVVLHPSVALL
ncbi:MAG: hypothetical protein Q9187_009626 [Circinaria calcarea]